MIELLTRFSEPVVILLLAVTFIRQELALQRLADSITALDEQIHDLTCHPGDRLGTGPAREPKT